MVAFCITLWWQADNMIHMLDTVVWQIKSSANKWSKGVGIPHGVKIGTQDFTFGLNAKALVNFKIVTFWLKYVNLVDIMSYISRCMIFFSGFLMF